MQVQTYVGKKKQKFLRNQENVGCISYDFVTTSEKKTFQSFDLIFLHVCSATERK